MAKKGQIFKKYSPEFKLSVILDMREHCLSYSETMRKHTKPNSWPFTTNNNVYQRQNAGVRCIRFKYGLISVVAIKF